MAILRKASIILPFIASTLAVPLISRQDDGTVNQTDINVVWPISYIALGDSFAAGIGAGHYTDASNAQVKQCKRFDGSYPTQVTSLLTQVEDKNFRFEACSGNVLEDISNQIQDLDKTKAQVITLSISGNDFNFGGVVEKCVYNIAFLDSTKDSECKTALQKSSDLINGDGVWAKYTQQVNNILDNVAIQDKFGYSWSTLVITGYAQFFGEAVDGDKCSNNRFPIRGTAAPVYGNLLRTNVRTQMNALVVAVNQKIQQKILPVNTDKIRFVDIDPLFEGHRFCEKGRTTDPAGGNDPNIWFISFDTTLSETEFAPNDSEEDQMWVAWNKGFESQFGDSDPDFRPGELRIAVNFHPKTQAHSNTALAVQAVVEQWGKDHQHNPSAPPMKCEGTNAGDIPQGIVIPALIEDAEVVSPNSLLAKLRAVLCANNCQIPDDIQPHTGAVATGAGGWCQISIGVQGGSEAYMERDRSISGDDQTQHCWDTTWAIIESCVNNGANEGWQAGVAPLPAFYQAGFRQLNAGTHDTISADFLLEKDLSGFQSVCGDGNGDCEANGCVGTWYICSQGPDVGCGCGYNSRFSTEPQPKSGLACKTDCCKTGPNVNAWWTAEWCAANCGGVADQFC
ncbi:SGNH hydrolase [Lophium mytilinum]|uniref:SGNH hydrolase n=1 Tax=Lophium mytilinum TaxID=390894 RepID=A0A6A6QAZ4_9PEZI|nr:SGNH hydrolase [Lophium mytilinum]